jgi:predicted O-methyltransferase YrrM
LISLDSDPRISNLVARLHAASEIQLAECAAYVTGPGRKSVSGTEAEVEAGRGFWRDKLVALEPDKARFCYSLCRAIGARTAIEAGTSYGVSTLYLAAAVRDNGGGTVIGTELEAEKAKIARRHFEEAGLASIIDLREGDLRQTLRDLPAPIDFALIDIWTPLSQPALALITPHMRRGAIAIADNTNTYRRAYGDYFAFLSDPKNGFITETLPFDGGLEMSVKVV